MTVAAPVEAVWRVVEDVTRTGDLSHECHQVAADLARIGETAGNGSGPDTHA